MSGDESDSSNNADQVVTLGDRVSDLVETWGVNEWWANIVATSALFLCLLCVGAILFFIIRPLILRVVKRTTEKTKVDWDDEIRGHGVFRWASHFGPGLFIYFACDQVLSETPVFAGFVQACAELYLILAGVMVVNGLLSFGHVVYRESEFAKKYPIGAFIQVFRLLAVLIAIILVCSSLFNQSPFVLLGGLGVFASVLILVFKDVLLGLAAGVQIVANRMITVGDWLEMPSRKADGSVLHIGLTTVKVRNWDNTITTVPTYSLITESFKNWRGMSESGGRRIKRSIVVELDSIKFLDQQLLDQLSKIQILSDYLSSKEDEIEDWNNGLGLDLKDSPLVNGRRQTNVGAFRAYMLEYIRNNKRIHQSGMTLQNVLAG
ncbi:MAG: mechanosensitive ion channel domain-containing protein [Verrucomicrobiota bacterium]